MKEHTLLDVMGKIDDAFIEEAAHPEILLKKKRLPLSTRKLGTLAACMIVVFGLIIAAPYLRISSQKEAAAEDMNASMQSALAEQFAAQADKEMALQSSRHADVQAQASMNAALQSSLQVEMESPSASSLMSSPQDAANPTKTPDTTEAVDLMPAEPQTKLQRIGEITFEYSEHVLFSLDVNENTLLTDLFIPSVIDGEEITELSDDFWSFCYTNPDIRAVTVPEGIESFGNIDPLKKTVEIICATGSAAERFFSERGYVVQAKQP